MLKRKWRKIKKLVLMIETNPKKHHPGVLFTLVYLFSREEFFLALKSDVSPPLPTSLSQSMQKRRKNKKWWVERWKSSYDDVDGGDGPKEDGERQKKPPLEENDGGREWLMMKDAWV